MAKAKVSRARKVSIEVVGNGYSVTIGDGGGIRTDGIFWVTCSGESVSGGLSSQLAGTYVFNDFSQLSAFLRKHLSAPTGP